MMDLQKGLKILRNIVFVLRNLYLRKSAVFFPLYVRIYFNNVQSLMASLCNKLILLFEFILQCFMADIHIVWNRTEHILYLSLRSCSMTNKVTGIKIKS